MIREPVWITSHPYSIICGIPSLGRLEYEMLLFIIIIY